MFFLRPSSGLISSHSMPPSTATNAAKPSATCHPWCSASQGVKVGEMVPPMFAPVFMTPERVPAWRDVKSIVLAQKAPTVK